jgi:pimeloyl-ACP methyl ester carboxylesterase
VPKQRINGIDLRYEVTGEGPAIAFVHGAGGNHLSWYQQVAYFSDRYRCITYDCRTFGESVDLTGEGLHAFPGDLLGLLDHLEVDSTLVVAQSLGGLTGFPFAFEHPERVRKLVMSDTTMGIPSLPPRGALGQGGPYAPSFPQRNPAGAMLYRQIGALNPPRNNLRNVSPDLARTLGVTADELVSMKVPTLFIGGAEEEMFTESLFRDAVEAIPNSRYEIIRAAGHSPYFERPDAYNQVLETFFNEGRE